MIFKSFPLEIFDNHAIIQYNGSIILIDTGSPITVHTTTNFQFFDQNYKVITNYPGINLTPQILSQYLSHTITTLLGNDLMKNYKILFDYENKVVTFYSLNCELEEIHSEYGENLRDFQYESIDDNSEIELKTFSFQKTELESSFNIPIVNLIINNSNYVLFLDTGAKLSYLSKELTEDYSSMGNEEDFHVICGKFITPTYKLACIFNGIQFDAKYGNLPPSLSSVLQVAKGVIGSDFFYRFKVLISYADNVLSIC